MKARTLIGYIAVGIMVVILQGVINLLPIAKYPLKLKACTFSLSSLLAHKSIVVFTQELRKEDLKAIETYRQELCFKNQKKENDEFKN